MSKSLAFIASLLVAFGCWAADTGAPPAFAETGQRRPILVNAFDDTIPQFVDGDSWQTTLILTNLSTSTAYYRVYFNADNGDVVNFNIVGVGNASSIFGQLGPGQTVELATPGTASTLTQGYASLFNYDRPANDAARVAIPVRMGGMAVFRRRLPGLPDQEAVVPMSASFDRNFTIPFDNRNGFVSGVAIVNNSVANGVVSLTARDNTGAILATDSFPLNFFTKVVYLVKDRYPALAGKAGILQYSISAGGFSGLGLRFNPTGSFTSTHPLTLATQ